MGIDLVRFSQTALPVARAFDKDKNKTLDHGEYASFEDKWNKEHSNKSPLLMQLHMNTLNDNAKKIAAECDTDDLKGVLTEGEIQKFMDECERRGINNPFKKGTSVKSVLTGELTDSIKSDQTYESKSRSWISDLKIKYTLAKNLSKLTIINFRGSDKFFHAVGNFEAMQKGSEESLKRFCQKQDEEKQNETRTENDRTEDLYANWLGQKFARMYPDAEPHELFSPLAPTGFNIEKSKRSVVRLFAENNKVLTALIVAGLIATPFGAKFAKKHVSKLLSNIKVTDFFKGLLKFKK